jgi:hypothetical protein
MGRKITIDSATLFNKGLEMIEARWLFDIEMPRVQVVVHPQSVVHSMVEYVDGSIIAQLSTPDMCLPIQYALLYPERLRSDRVQTNFAKIGQLTFEEPDTDRFPALGLARRAGEIGGTLPAVLNAANEVAVERFCARQLGFTGIARLVTCVMNAHRVVEHGVDQRIDVAGRDQATRRVVHQDPVVRLGAMSHQGRQALKDAGRARVAAAGRHRGACVIGCIQSGPLAVVGRDHHQHVGQAGHRAQGVQGVQNQGPASQGGVLLGLRRARPGAGTGTGHQGITTGLRARFHAPILEST